jgi:hypothetical protein
MVRRRTLRVDLDQRNLAVISHTYAPWILKHEAGGVAKADKEVVLGPIFEAEAAHLLAQLAGVLLQEGAKVSGWDRDIE